MTPEERLSQLEHALRSEFGCFTRYLNDVHEQYGSTATIEQKIAVAEDVLRAGNLGVAAHMREVQRKQRRLSQSS
jgi:hypothetical protein